MRCLCHLSSFVSYWVESSLQTCFAIPCWVEWVDLLCGTYCLQHKRLAFECNICLTEVCGAVGSFGPQFVQQSVWLWDSGWICWESISVWLRFHCVRSWSKGISIESRWIKQTEVHWQRHITSNDCVSFYRRLGIPQPLVWRIVALHISQGTFACHPSCAPWLMAMHYTNDSCPFSHRAMFARALRPPHDDTKVQYVPYGRQVEFAERLGVGAIQGATKSFEGMTVEEIKRLDERLTEN